MNQIQAYIGLQLVSEYIAARDDAEAKEHFNALVLRLQALENEAQRQATTMIDESGNITIGLNPVSVQAVAVPAK